MKHHHRITLLILEAMCGPDPFCRPTSRELAALLGCAPTYARLVLREMEDAGLAGRVHGEFNELAGGVLRKRSDPDRPVGDTPDAPAAAIEELHSGGASRGNDRSEEGRRG